VKFRADKTLASVEKLGDLFAPVDNRGAPPDPETGRRVVGEIVLAMRRDLLRKSRLDYAAFQYVDVYETKKE
jgi:hypothetical protein